MYVIYIYITAFTKGLNVLRATKSYKPEVVVISSDSDEYGNTPRPGREQNAKSRYVW